MNKIDIFKDLMIDDNSFLDISKINKFSGLRDSVKNCFICHRTIPVFYAVCPWCGWAINKKNKKGE